MKEQSMTTVHRVSDSPAPLQDQALASINAKLDAITSSLRLIARSRGDRLTRVEYAARLGVSTKTIQRYLRDKKIPQPDAQGRWLLEEVIEWETHRPVRR